MTTACNIRVRGVVQGVGFRPFVFRLARANTLAGWVLNAGDGVEIRLEGDPARLAAFLESLRSEAPPAATIAAIDVQPAEWTGLGAFTIRESRGHAHPTARISPDLATCAQCLRELFDPADPRAGYPYINCTDCGPRYSIVLGLPYDRPATTMRDWAMDARCAGEYDDPDSRRFHAQPVACPACGPHYYMMEGETRADGDAAVVRRAADLLRAGKILAVKGLGGYHLACDAANAGAVEALRERKFRKEKPFAVMVKDESVADRLTSPDDVARALLRGAARPIVLVPARRTFEGVAPDNDELGIVLPYTPLHHLLFAAGAPEAIVMTSANRSSEPIAYEDDDALARLSGIADAFVVGERPIARRVEDSVARAGAWGPVILRRGRGYAPAAVAEFPIERPVLAVGADLKNSVTLVVDGQAFVSQHIGDLDDFDAARAFDETIRDLLDMYRVPAADLLVACDAHPGYRSTVRARALSAGERRAVQHHRAHVASVLAERGAFDARVLGVSLDGTGYGDDGAIWGCEFFAGSVKQGFERVGHLRPASLVGGDAAARHPVQAAAGFLTQLDALPAMDAAPFAFPARWRDALRVLESGARTFPTTSMGRLFDTAAALLGFTRGITFEGQAAIWVEHLARRAMPFPPSHRREARPHAVDASARPRAGDAYPFPFDGRELDFRPLLAAVASDRAARRPVSEIARAFQAGVARGVFDAATALCARHGLDVVVLSGGVFQNELLMTDLHARFAGGPVDVWTNHAVPPNDGGISLGQAALAALGAATPRTSAEAMSAPGSPVAPAATTAPPIGGDRDA